MGMYTKYSINLNIFSIAVGSPPAIEQRLKDRLQKLKDIFFETHAGRPWVCDGTQVVLGLNGCTNLYVHGEIKNYNRDIEAWFQFLCDNFPKCEGFLYIQYEETKRPNIYCVSHGQCLFLNPAIDFEGYGNNSELDLPDAIILNLERKENPT